MTDLDPGFRRGDDFLRVHHYWNYEFMLYIIDQVPDKVVCFKELVSEQKPNYLSFRPKGEILNLNINNTI